MMHFVTKGIYNFHVTTTNLISYTVPCSYSCVPETSCLDILGTVLIFIVFKNVFEINM